MANLPVPLRPDVDKLHRTIRAKQTEIENLTAQLGQLDTELADALADQAAGDAKAANKASSLKAKRTRVDGKLGDATMSLQSLADRLDDAEAQAAATARQHRTADRLKVADKRNGLAKEAQRHIEALGAIYTEMNATGSDLFDLARGAVDYDRIKDRWTVGQDLLSMLTIALGQAGIPFTKGLSDYQLSQMPDLATRFAERQAIYTQIEPALDDDEPEAA